MNKKLVYIPNAKLVLRDLNLINFFSESNDKNFFLFTNNKNLPKNIKKNYSLVEHNKFRSFIWDLSHYIRRLKYEFKNFNTVIENQNLELDKFRLNIIRISRVLKLDLLFMVLIEKILEFSIPDYLKRISRVSEIIFLGSPKDIIFDDLMYLAKKKSLRTKLIFTNWDNATTKPYKIKPDEVFCWGKETESLSKKIHKIKSSSIGSIRFEKHQELKKKYRYISKNFIKKKLKLKKENKYILFAGVTLPFDEFNSLKILNDYLVKYETNYKILYKPHPYGRIKIPKKKIKQLKNIVYVKNNIFKNFKYYFYLINSTEGIISPYSTMILEGFFFQKPALCLAYNDNNLEVFNWKLNSKYQPHLKIIKNKKITIWCYKLADLSTSLKLFLKKINQSNKNYSTYKNIISKSIHFDDTNYSQRLKKIIYE